MAWGRKAEGKTVHFLQTSRSALDELDDRKLFEVASKARQDQGSYTQPIAERLDQILTIRTTRLLQSARTTRDDCDALTNLISRLAHDTVAAELEALPARYATRWQMLKDMLQASLRLREHQRLAEQSVAQSPRDALWKAIAQRLGEAGAAGVPMAEVGDIIRNWPDSPASKGGISLLVSQMRAAGWVESVARGRTRQLFAGHRAPSFVAPLPESRPRQLPHGQLTTSFADTKAASSARPLGVARSLVCYNQGAFLGYYYLGHEKHAELRKAMEPATNERGNQRASIRGDVRRCRRALDDFLNTGLRSAAEQSFKELQQHFAGRSATAPRICLKGASQASPNGHLISPIIRDATTHQYKGRSSFGQNTGLDEVARTGQPYLCQDMAELALRGDYTNPRLSPERVEQLAARFNSTPEGRDNSITMADWQNCWTDSDIPGADPASFYRSTLIVPLTFRYSQLDVQFAKRLGEKLPELSPPGGWERAVLGFLCMDHVEPHFFQPQFDTDIGYVMADMLSLYVFTRLALTTLSNSYRDAQRVVLPAVVTSWHYRLRKPPPGRQQTQESQPAPNAAASSAIQEAPRAKVVNTPVLEPA
jgi:hypothetical protein